tara:strand:+ start:602 stop:1381 length:780 start_codon:yes stop_codon:yes gene_type:complete
MDCKTCKTCGIEKPLSEFYKGRKHKNTQYYQPHCKPCVSKEKQQYYQKKREVILTRQKEYKADPKIKEKQKKYIAQYNANPKNKEARLAYMKKYNKEYNANPKNKEKRKKYNADPKNKERIRAQQRKRDKERRQSDPLYKLVCNIRTRISLSITNAGFKKNSKTHKILNCSFEEFMLHLEKQFNSGITWENYGKWHLDHIVPVSLASTEEEIIKLNHYKNFQPMWGPENNSKNDKIIHEMITPELQEKYKEILQRTQPA